MSPKKSDPAVTRSEFLAETKSIRTQISKLALEVIKNRDELKEVKETMATKNDIGKILNTIDSFSQRVETYDRQTRLHDHRIKHHNTRPSTYSRNSARLKT